MSEMREEDLPEKNRKGPLSWMARNSVAANLLMFVILVGGIMGGLRVIQEVFPEFSLDIVVVTVPYPGATPDEVEQAIVLAIEEEVRGIDGVKRIKSNSNENAGSVFVELNLGADPQTVLNDVKGAVDRISTFPEESERPSTSLMTQRRDVISLIISGNTSLNNLHALGEKARLGMLQMDGVSQVETSGVPPLEVSIDVPRETLESMGITLAQVAGQIRAASLELSGGGLETKGGEILVKVNDRRMNATEFGDIIIRGTAAGYQVKLGDIATITDGFEDTNLTSAFNGQPAIQLTAYRIGEETPSGVAAAVNAYAEELRLDVPEGIEVTIWNDTSISLDARIKLLLVNGVQGLALVLLILAMFLNLRLAIWVSLGIPISIAGAFLVMPSIDISVNMISLFAFIITLGLIVDDAIVVGENIYEKTQQGMSRLQASIEGAQEMAMPVTFSILTTMAAFSPLFFVPGFMGKIFSNIPYIVVSVLAFSMIESFLVLPAHLGHGKDKTETEVEEARGITGLIGRGQAWIAVRLEIFISDYYRPAVDWVVHHRHIAMASATALLIVSFSLVGSGVVPFEFFPKLEGELVTATVRLPYGTNVDITREMHDILQASGQQAIEDMGGESSFKGAYARIGQLMIGNAGGEIGSNLTSIVMNIGPTEDRSFSAKEFAEAWTQNTPPLPGVESVIYSFASGPGSGAAVSVQLSHNDVDTLAAASKEFTEALERYSDLTGVENEYSAGKVQYTYHLLPAATNLGLTSQEIARQMRASFFGVEALREQRGRNEIKVMVRLPEDQRESEYDLSQFLIRTPSGANVPLATVATMERGTSPTVIRREEGRRVVTIGAELAPGIKSAKEALDDMKGNVLPGLMEKYDGLNWDLVGMQREQKESFDSLKQNYLLALIVMYILLAIPFKSYYQPLIIMSSIPFGIVGAIFGHILMDYQMSIISVFGVIALSGVVINDSLVLIAAANKFRKEGMTALESVALAGQRRLRPILLTSLTTFFGLMPMILETDLQARFLIPMAISLGFGVLFATVIVLLLVPALFIIMEDMAAFVTGGVSPDEEERLAEEAEKKKALDHTNAGPTEQPMAAFTELATE